MSVFKRSEEMQTAFDRGKIVRDLNGGTPAMIAAGEIYLPKLPRENQLDYAARLNGGELVEGHKQTRNYFSGQVFSKPITLTDSGKDKFNFESLNQDADMVGNDLRTWAQDFFAAGIDEGMAAVFVDYPHVETRDNNGRTEYWDEQAEQWRPKTSASDKEKGWRPFFVLIRQSQILGGRFETVNGKRACVMLRVHESYIKDRGKWDSDDELGEQVRVFYPGRWELWRKEKIKDGGNEDHEYLHSEGVLGPKDKPFDFIPVKFFTPGDKIGELGHIPAMEGLAYLDVKYWRSSCDHDALIRRMRNPVLFGKMLGCNEEGDIEVGLSRLVHSNDPSGDLRYVGVMDKEVAESNSDLSRIESKMASRGLMLLTPGQTNATKTAFQAQREVSESTSTLKDWALDLRNCLDEAMKYVAMWEGNEAGSEPWVQVNTDFSAALAFDYKLYEFAIDNRVISRQSTFDELRRRGSFSESLEWETEKDLIEDDTRSDFGPGPLIPGAMLPLGIPESTTGE